MERIAKFSKVSFDQFVKDYKDTFDGTAHELNDEQIRDIYDKIQLPKRATSGSAGYDVLTPVNFSLLQSETIKIPTGIRVEISDGWFCGAFPKSGLGFKYRAQLDNTIGIIDSDYYYSDNEGHVFIKMTNDSKTPKMFVVNQGKSFCQLIFLPYGITIDDNATGIRNGGFGSTNS